jgi:hypothetical protein
LGAGAQRGGPLLAAGLGALLGAAVLAGCPEERMPACAASADCASGYLCFGGVCVSIAVADGGTQAAAGSLGAACGSRADCAQAPSLSCLTEGGAGFPQGYCSQSCASVSCPEGAVCGDLSSTSAGVKACLHACAAGADCRPGYTCCASANLGCVPEGMCPDLSGQPSATLGSACASAADCSGGEQCNTNAVFPGGICTRPCSLGVAASCPQNGACASTVAGPLCLSTCAGAGASCRSGYPCGLFAGTGSAKVCAPPAAAPPPVCSPPSTAATWKLVNGGVAGPAQDPGATCARPIAAAALPSARVLALGQHKVGEVVKFAVPAGTGGFSIVSQLAGAAPDSISYTIGGKARSVPNTVVPGKVVRPDGTALYDDNAAPPADPSAASAWYVTTSPSTGAFTVPNTSQALSELKAGALPAGEWSFQVSDYAFECTSDSACSGGSTQGQYDVTVVLQPAASSTGYVDVSFYLVSQAYSAAAAMTDAHFARFLSTLALLLGRAGLCLRTITLYDVQPWAKARYAAGVNAGTTDPCSELDQMFTLSQADDSLHFFFVDDIGQTGSGGGTVVGIDGTIPGPSGFGGTVHSGAVVNVSDLAKGAGCTAAPSFSTSPTTGTPICGADYTAYLTAHEAGHWLGLYHASEADGSLYDPVADTARCLCNTLCVGAAAAASCYQPGKAYPASPTYLYGAQCSSTTKSDCGGADLLMFWVIDNLSVGNVSAQEGQLARANPAVH